MIFVNLTGVITNFANYANKVWFVLQCLLVQSIPGPLATCGISKIVSVNCDLKYSEVVSKEQILLIIITVNVLIL